MLKLNVYLYAQLIRLIQGARPRGGCNPPSRDIQTSREALEWRISPRGSAPNICGNFGFASFD